MYKLVHRQKHGRNVDWKTSWSYKYSHDPIPLHCGMFPITKRNQYYITTALVVRNSNGNYTQPLVMYPHNKIL